MKRLYWILPIIIIVVILTSLAVVAVFQHGTPTPTIQSPTPQPKEFFQLSDVLSAYVDDSLDQSFTPMELSRDAPQPVTEMLPRIKTAIFDDQGNFLATLGDGGQALLIGRFAITSVAAASEIAVPLLQEADLPSELRGKNLKRGAILVFGVRPDGIQEYEILKGSLGQDQNKLVELFERPNKSQYPYPLSLPYEIEDIQNLKARDPLIFYGYQKGGVLAQKTARVSTVDYQHSFFYFNGPVTTNDVGAPVFLLKNGRQKLVGLAIGSFMRQGNETKAMAFSIKEALKFIEEKTGNPVLVSQDSILPIETNPVLKQKLIRALSDNLYDFSFDLADLKNTDPKEVQQWVKPLEIAAQKADGDGQEKILRYTAILIDRYAVIPVTPDNRAILEGWDSVKYGARILWGGSLEDNEDEPIAYEEAAFMGFGSQAGQKKIAVFLRFNDTKFPVPSGAPFVIGSSGELAAGNALYASGFLDMSPMLINFPHNSDILLYPDTPTAFLTGRGSEQKTFYFQGSIFSDDIGAPIFALRDGNLELVGITLGNDEPKSEIFNAAIGIETVLEAVRQIACPDSSPGCANATRGIPAAEFQSLDLAEAEEAAQDAVRIFNILQEAGLENSLLAIELRRPNLAVLSNNVKKIIVALFNESGNFLPTPDGPFREGQAIMLSPEYILVSSAMLPNVINPPPPGATGVTVGPDLSDLTSDTFPLGKKTITFRFAILHASLKPYEIMEGFANIPFISEIFERQNDPAFLQNQAEVQEFLTRYGELAARYGHAELTEDIEGYGNGALVRQRLADPSHQQFLNSMIRFYLSRMEIPEVVLVDRQTGYALLRRQLPPFGYYLSSFADVPHKIGDQRSIQPGKNIYIAQARDAILPYSALVPTVSGGTIGASPDRFGVFPVSGMIFQNSIGAPIFQISNNGKPVFVGMVKTATIYSEIETEGSAVPLQLILEKIKQKTGLDPLAIEPSPVLPIP